MSEQKTTSGLIQEISTEEQQHLSGGYWHGGWHSPWGGGWRSPWGGGCGGDRCYGGNHLCC